MELLESRRLAAGTSLVNPARSALPAAAVTQRHPPVTVQLDEEDPPAKVLSAYLISYLDENDVLLATGLLDCYSGLNLAHTGFV